MSPIIAIDFDGVIHAHTSAWTNAHDVLDPPVDGALAFIREAIDAGFHVVIHTTPAPPRRSRTSTRGSRSTASKRSTPGRSR